jgi:hypothetical protein
MDDQIYPIGQLTNTRRSDGSPEPDGTLKALSRDKIIHYRQVYLNRPDPISFMPLVVDTSGRIYDDFLRQVVPRQVVEILGRTKIKEISFLYVFLFFGKRFFFQKKEH